MCQRQNWEIDYNVVSTDTSQISFSSTDLLKSVNVKIDLAQFFFGFLVSSQDNFLGQGLLALEVLVFLEGINYSSKVPFPC